MISTTSASSSAEINEIPNLQRLRDRFSSYAKYNNDHQYPSLKPYFRKIRSLTKGFNTSLIKLRKHQTVISDLLLIINPCARIRRQLVFENGHIEFLQQKLSGIYKKIAETQEKIQDIIAQEFSSTTPLTTSSTTTTSTSTTNMSSSLPTDQVFFELGCPILDFSDLENDLL